MYSTHTYRARAGSRRAIEAAEGDGYIRLGTAAAIQSAGRWLYHLVSSPQKRQCPQAAGAPATSGTCRDTASDHGRRPGGGRPKAAARHVSHPKIAVDWPLFRPWLRGPAAATSESNSVIPPGQRAARAAATARKQADLLLVLPARIGRSSQPSPGAREVWVEALATNPRENDSPFIRSHSPPGFE
jgi:hypothetical protein